MKTFPAGELLDARRYLAEHPKFYSVAKANFWLPFFELLDLTALTVDKRPFFMQEGKLAVRVQGHSKEYKVRNWTAIEQELKEDLRGKTIQAQHSYLKNLKNTSKAK